MYVYVCLYVCVCQLNFILRTKSYYPWSVTNAKFSTHLNVYCCGGIGSVWALGEVSRYRSEHQVGPKKSAFFSVQRFGCEKLFRIKMHFIDCQCECNHDTFFRYQESDLYLNVNLAICKLFCQASPNNRQPHILPQYLRSLDSFGLSKYCIAFLL